MRRFLVLFIACAKTEVPPQPAATTATDTPSSSSTQPVVNVAKAFDVKPECKFVNSSGEPQLESVPFDLDQSELTPAAQRILDKNATCLKEAPGVSVAVEGHCDERGTVEYNLSLGEHRAATVVKYLERMGIDRKRLRPLSKGENAPICLEQTEACWAKNRRVELHP